VVVSFDRTTVAPTPARASQNSCFGIKDKNSPALARGDEPGCAVILHNPWPSRPGTRGQAVSPEFGRNSTARRAPARGDKPAAPSAGPALGAWCPGTRGRAASSLAGSLVNNVTPRPAGTPGMAKERLPMATATPHPRGDEPDPDKGGRRLLSFGPGVRGRAGLVRPLYSNRCKLRSRKPAEACDRPAGSDHNITLCLKGPRHG
jgi:hypothetical protein